MPNYPMKTRKKCEICGKWFLPNTSTQRFCGSTLEKYGCSWKEYLKRRRIKAKRRLLRVNRALRFYEIYHSKQSIS